MQSDILDSLKKMKYRTIHLHIYSSKAFDIINSLVWLYNDKDDNYHVSQANDNEVVIDIASSVGAGNFIDANEAYVKQCIVRMIDNTIYNNTYCTEIEYDTLMKLDYAITLADGQFSMNDPSSHVFKTTTRELLLLRAFFNGDAVQSLDYDTLVGKPADPIAAITKDTLKEALLNELKKLDESVQESLETKLDNIEKYAEEQHRIFSEKVRAHKAEFCNAVAKLKQECPESIDFKKLVDSIYELAERVRCDASGKHYFEDVHIHTF